MRNVLSLVIAAAVMVGPASIAKADDAERVTIIVPHGDLDLATGSGVVELKERISEAAREVCTYEIFDGQPTEALDRQCYHLARSAALETLYKKRDTRVAVLTR